MLFYFIKNTSLQFISMKKNIILLIFFISTISALAQKSNIVLVRHDTTLLKSAECEWLIKSLAKNDPALTSEIGKPIPLILLQAIEKGKLTAINPVTNKAIPGKLIYTTGIGVDTMEVYDDAGNATYKAIQRQRSADNIPLIRIYQDWFFDVASGKFKTEIKWIELMEDVHSPATGIFLGHTALCRIYY